MGSLGDYLMEELSLKTSFTIPIGGGIPVPQSAVTTWVIMAIVVLLCIIFVRNLKVIPEGPQVYVEALVGFIYNFIGGLVGEKGKRYIPFLGTILIYLGCANISGFFRARWMWRMAKRAMMRRNAAAAALTPVSHWRRCRFWLLSAISTTARSVSFSAGYFFSSIACSFSSAGAAHRRSAAAVRPKAVANGSRSVTSG